MDVLGEYVAGALEWILAAPRRSPQRWFLLFALAVVVAIVIVVAG